MEQERARTRRSFTDEFKRDAVAMVVVGDQGHKIVDVAGRLGVGEGTLGNWVRQERTNRGERAGLTTSERSKRLTEASSGGWGVGAAPSRVNGGGPVRRESAASVSPVGRVVSIACRPPAVDAVGLVLDHGPGCWLVAGCAPSADPCSRL